MTDKEYIVCEDSFSYEMRRYGELEELIRCKDCYWYDEEDKTCVRYSFLSQPTDYCSNAERKEG